MDVDADCPGLAEHVADVRPVAGQMLPPATSARTDHDLTEVMLAREGGDGPRGTLIAQVVPAGAEVRGQTSQLVQRSLVWRRGLVFGDMHNVKRAFIS
jgi:hypothetical protein